MKSFVLDVVRLCQGCKVWAVGGSKEPGVCGRPREWSFQRREPSSWSLPAELYGR